MDYEFHKHKVYFLKLIEKDVHLEEFLEYLSQWMKKSIMGNHFYISVIPYNNQDDQVSYNLLDFLP